MELTCSGSPKCGAKRGTVTASLVVVVAVKGAAGRMAAGGAMGRSACFARVAELAGATDGVEVENGDWTTERTLDAPQ